MPGPTGAGPCALSTVLVRLTASVHVQVEYGLQAGTSENSYLIQGPDATALVDVPDQAFVAAFSEALTRTVDVSKLDYLVVGHISPKRVECVAQLGKLVQQKKGEGTAWRGDNGSTCDNGNNCNDGSSGNNKSNGNHGRGVLRACDACKGWEGWPGRLPAGM